MMIKAKSAKTAGSAKARATTPARAKAAAPAKSRAKKPAKRPAKNPTKGQVNWSGAIRQALQEKQAPKTWPGGGNEAWKGAPTRKN
jgi:hypothetical protein